jgi:hypothetical protein
MVALRGKISMLDPAPVKLRQFPRRGLERMALCSHIAVADVTAIS